ncbi:MAG: protein translocase subunit SecF [Ignavibacteria bacterium CG_4_8_14_3_um_filter_37_9]|nr:protein translocase subunit SecF [Ignavibacteria bacterium]OIO23245.1 MAG: protein-export membrane protein SecF [Ignavibacteria bacterium CG1_02_37_35]PIP77583.1 MAG: protein translocase subunit SecF [Ignavibacteria bacterium CG22_combo_CG10-13_8_21_14_all_37_15]PIS45365.1 MAG: protein translocase subunit SecF [Ignavibacteria bacterium CG08_land_8_20_14_0_20_37_9]PIX00355.1 MAG: protein translocase subunit SecF [Ignavibacteria bacterium CG_4_8_14_3_um_filter_37_9]PIX94450.1 MAG: protein tra
MQLFHNLNIDFMGKRKFFYVLSASFFLLGLLNIVFRGLQFGIDFKGGTEIVVKFDEPIKIAQLRENLNATGLGEVEIKTFGDNTGALIRTELQELPANLFPKIRERIEHDINSSFPSVAGNFQSDKTTKSLTYTFSNSDTASAIAQKLFLDGFQSGKVTEEATNTQVVVQVGISDWIKESLKNKAQGNAFQIIREERVGPKVGNELKVDTIIAVVLSLIVILIYLAFRYKFIFALGAVLALFHDVLITLGLYAVLYNIIPGLNLEVSLTVVAAFLTLIGYSINDTVIVFDRVRETLKIHKTESLESLINLAINKTMSRTILTGGTTLLSIFILLILGGEVLRAFAFTMFFGIIIGTYSSVFIASAFVLDYAMKYHKKVEF